MIRDPLVGIAGNGSMLSVVYLWSEAELPATKIRIISARKATHARGVWEYFSGEAEQKGVQMSGLLSEVLRRDRD
jgi:hypothetical protein